MHMKIFLLYLLLLLSTSSDMFSQVHWSRVTDTDYGYKTISQVVINKVVGSGQFLVATGFRKESKKVGPYIMDTALTQYFGISQDSGRTWQSIEPPIYSPKTQSYTRIEQIVVLDSLNLIACGGLSTTQKNHLLRSSDAGKSWVTFADSFKGTIHNPRISFYDSKRGVMVSGFEFTFYRTDDGGKSWTSYSAQHHIDTLFYDYYNHPVWIDSMTIFNYNYNRSRDSQILFPHVFRTFISTNAGQTWKQLGCTIKGYEGDSSTQSHFLEVFFPTPEKGYAVGRVNKDGNWLNAVFITSDKGMSWNIVDSINIVSGNNYIRGKTFGQDTFIYMTGGGKIRQTNDGGKSWKFIVEKNIINHLINFDERLNTCYFYTPNNAVAFSSIFSSDGSVVNNPAIYKLEQGISDIDNPYIDAQINETHSVYLYNVYPQPAKDNITLQVYALPQSDGLTLKLYNSYGVEVADFTHQLQETPSFFGWKSVSIQIQNIPTGVYIAHIKGNSISRSISILIVK